MGHLSPLDGIGPEELGVQEFETLLDDRAGARGDPGDQPDGEGEATAHYFSQLVRERGMARAASHTACRSAGSSNMSTAAPWRTRWPGGKPVLKRHRPVPPVSAGGAGARQRPSAAR